MPRSIVERNTYVIPESLPFASAAPLEPLATVVHGMAESGVELGDTVVVHGAGPIGLMFVRLATLRGANVISVDLSAWRLTQATRAGAVATLDLSGVDSPEAVVDLWHVKQSTEPSLRTDAEGRTTITVPPLSAAVWRASGTLPRRKDAPAIHLEKPSAGGVVGSSSPSAANQANHAP